MPKTLMPPTRNHFEIHNAFNVLANELSHEWVIRNVKDYIYYGCTKLFYKSKLLHVFSFPYCSNETYLNSNLESFPKD